MSKTQTDPNPTDHLCEFLDRIDDLMEGFDHWKAQKLAAMDWSTADEMLVRWVDYTRTGSR